MKKIVRRILPALLLLSLPVAGQGAETSVNSATFLRFQQSAPVGFPSKTLVPATEFLGLDVDKVGIPNLSLHVYGWGQAELADRDGNDYKSDGSLTYGYLQYRFGAANAQARAGRFFVTEGIVNEHVDGVSARTDLPYGFALSAFGGAPVHTASIPSAGNDGKGDGIFGGRLRYRMGGKLEVGLAGVYESKAPQPQTPLPAGSFGDHRLVGYDIWLNPHPMAQLTGHTSYNTETEKVAEHSYLLLVRPLKDLSLTASFDEQHDRAYFFSSVLFASLLTNLGQESRAIGGTATYSLKKGELSGDFKHYSREVGKAERFGGDFKSNTLMESIRTGFGYHYLRASSDFALIPGPNASASYHEVRGWLMRDTKKYFASFDLIGYFFRKEVEGRNNAWEALGSLGYHFTPALSLSGDLSYGQNPQYNEEVRGLLRLTYNMNYAKGGSK